MHSGTLAPTPAERVRALVAAHRDARGPLLPVLHAIQSEFGFVDPALEPVVAAALNLSTAEVHGVVTFYRDFRRAPAGQVHVRICRAEACQSVGSGPLVDHARARLGIDVGETTPDGSVSLDEVFCLGNCALGPAVQVGDRLHGRVGAARFDALVGEAR